MENIKRCRNCGADTNNRGAFCAGCMDESYKKESVDIKQKLITALMNAAMENMKKSMDIMDHAIIISQVGCNKKGAELLNDMYALNAGALKNIKTIACELAEMES